MRVNIALYGHTTERRHFCDVSGQVCLSVFSMQNDVRKNMSEIFQNISDIFQITSEIILFSCGKFQNAETQKPPKR